MITFLSQFLIFIQDETGNITLKSLRRRSSIVGRKPSDFTPKRVHCIGSVSDDNDKKTSATVSKPTESDSASINTKATDIVTDRTEKSSKNLDKIEKSSSGESLSEGFTVVENIGTHVEEDGLSQADGVRKRVIKSRRSSHESSTSDFVSLDKSSSVSSKYAESVASQDLKSLSSSRSSDVGVSTDSGTAIGVTQINSEDTANTADTADLNDDVIPSKMGSPSHSNDSQTEKKTHDMEVDSMAG